MYMVFYGVSVTRQHSAEAIYSAAMSAVLSLGVEQHKTGRLLSLHRVIGFGSSFFEILLAFIRKSVLIVCCVGVVLLLWTLDRQCK